MVARRARLGALVAALVCALVLALGAPTQALAKQSQTIAFAESSVEKTFLEDIHVIDLGGTINGTTYYDELLSNTGKGTGAITFTSSDSSVFEILTESGTATEDGTTYTYSYTYGLAKKPGTVTITATKAADDTYNSATASMKLTFNAFDLSTADSAYLEFEPDYYTYDGTAKEPSVYAYVVRGNTTSGLDFDSLDLVCTYENNVGTPSGDTQAKVTVTSSSDKLKGEIAGTFTISGTNVAQMWDVSAQKTLYYKTLAEAFADAKDGDRITLLQDVDLTGTITLTYTTGGTGNQCVLLDLNGHTVTSTASPAIELTQYIELTVKDSTASSGTSTGGSIKNTSTAGLAVKVNGVRAALILEDGANIVSSGSFGTGVNVTKGSVSMNGGSITAVGNGIVLAEGTTASITGGTITAYWPVQVDGQTGFVSGVTDSSGAVTSKPTFVATGTYSGQNPYSHLSAADGWKLVDGNGNDLNTTGDGDAVAKSATVALISEPATVDAETPTITTQPSGKSYTAGDTATALSVAASVSDGGTLSYQWYSNATDSTTGGTAISGATRASYTPPTSAAGTTYYYCVVTNTNNAATNTTTASTTSNTAKIEVAKPQDSTTMTVTQADYTYGETAPAYALSGVSGGSVSSVRYTGTTNAGASYDSASAPTDAGSYSVTVTYETSTTVYAASDSFTVKRAANAISGLACADVTYGSTPSPSASATYGTPTYTYAESAGGSFSEWSTTNAVGTYYVKASVAQSANYEAAEATATFKVAKAKLTATYAGETITYGEEPALAVNVTGFVGGETASTAAGYTAPTVAASSTDAGSHRLTPSGGAADNYSFHYESGTLTINKATASIEWPSAEAITYGEPLSESALSGGSTDLGTFVWTEPSAILEAGSQTASVTFTPDAQMAKNYTNLTAQTGSVSVTVNKATPAITITEDSITADGDTCSVTLTVTVKGLTGDGLKLPNGRVMLTARSADMLENLIAHVTIDEKTGKATVIWDGAAKNTTYVIRAYYVGDANYAADAQTLGVNTALMSQQIEIAPVGENKDNVLTYGDEAFTLALSDSGSGTGAVTWASSDSSILAVDADTGKATVKGHGEVVVTAKKAGDDTYNEAEDSIEIEITKRAITITADSKTSKQGDDMPELTYAVGGSGLATGDSFSAEPALSCHADTTDEAGDFEIAVSGGAIKNADGTDVTGCYSISYAPGTLTVERDTTLYTVEIPVTVKVVQGGEATPPAESFTIQAAFDTEIPDEWAGELEGQYSVEVEGSPVATNGVGDYATAIVKVSFTRDAYRYYINDAWVRITQVAGSTDGWAYDDYVYSAYIEQAEDGSFYVSYLEVSSDTQPVPTDGSAESVVFTNTYTKDVEPEPTPTPSNPTDNSNNDGNNTNATGSSTSKVASSSTSGAKLAETGDATAPFAATAFACALAAFAAAGCAIRMSKVN